MEHTKQDVIVYIRVGVWFAASTRCITSCILDLRMKTLTVCSQGRRRNLTRRLTRSMPVYEPQAVDELACYRMNSFDTVDGW